MEININITKYQYKNIRTRCQSTVANMLYLYKIGGKNPQCFLKDMFKKVWQPSVACLAFHALQKHTCKASLRQISLVFPSYNQLKQGCRVVGILEWQFVKAGSVHLERCGVSHICHHPSLQRESKITTTTSKKYIYKNDLQNKPSLYFRSKIAKATEALLKHHSV